MHRIRRSRLVRLIVALTAISAFTIGGITYGARTVESSGFGCLMTLSGDRPNKLLDLNTGMVARYRNGIAGQPGIELNNTSPNGRYVSYLKPGSVDRYSLVVEERTSGKV